MRMKFGFVVVATFCFLWNQAQSSNNSTEENSSLLQTVVGDAAAVTPPFRIHGLDGKCAQAPKNDYMKLRKCGTLDIAERFTFHSDGTLRVNGSCLMVSSTDQYRYVWVAAECNGANREFVWQIRITDRQILHPETGLVLSVTTTVTHDDMFALEANIFSTYETFRLDYQTPVPTARIEGMNGLCLQTANDEVWLGPCGSSIGGQKWLIYPDGTIRPTQKTYNCLNFDNFMSRRVLLTYCRLSRTTSRWLFTENSTLWIERFNMVLDVPHSDPSLRWLGVYPPNGGANQMWRIFYD